MMKFSFSFAQRIPYNVTEYFCHDCRMICWFQIQITCFFTKKILVSYLSPYFMSPTYMLPKNLPSIEMHYIGNLRVVLTLTLQPDLSQTSSLREKCPNTDIFLSIFSRIRTENGPKKIRIWTISTLCMLCLSDYYLGSSTRPLKLSWGKPNLLMNLKFSYISVASLKLWQILSKLQLLRS